VITESVPPDALGLGRGRQIVREQWATTFRAKSMENKHK